MKTFFNIFLIISIFFLTSCEDFLEEEAYTEYDPDSFLQSEESIEALLVSTYSSVIMTGGEMRTYDMILQEFPTDIALESGGGLEREVLPILQFTWDPTLGFFNNFYIKFYDAISKANTVLRLTSDISNNIEEKRLQKFKAEARFIRAFSYYLLHNLFGPTPIIEIPSGASLSEIEKIGKETPRATEQEYRDYVEADLKFAAEVLEQDELSSRANKGVSLALLVKFYLNNKEWEKVVKISEEVLEMNYTLYPDYTKLFSVEGEDNNEFIFRFEALIGSPQTNKYMAHAFPPRYPTLPNWRNLGAQFRTYTAFYESFETNDVRKELFLTQYTPIGSSEIVYLNRDKKNKSLNNVRSFKYVPDPDGIGPHMGNDIPYVRLADIILAKAEAINEINGPTDEAINLINRIRLRAKTDRVDIAQFSSKKSLRSFILAERGREFFTEGLRREDLIRHKQFIEKARERGINAEDYRILYPIPQPQIDNNSNLQQNPGYN